MIQKKYRRKIKKNKNSKFFENYFLFFLYVFSEKYLIIDCSFIYNIILTYKIIITQSHIRLQHYRVTVSLDEVGVNCTPSGPVILQARNRALDLGVLWILPICINMSHVRLLVGLIPT